MTDRQVNILDQIEHTKTQERYSIQQVCKVFHNAGILPDDTNLTKRQGMDENRMSGAKTSHDVHSGTAVSWSTYHSYRAACTPLALYARNEYGIRDIYQLTPQVVSDYLKFAVDCEVKFSTFDKNCSAIEKFCECINQANTTHSPRQDFHSVIDQIRKGAKSELPSSDYTTRAYNNPSAIIEKLPTNLQIVAELQYRCGLRISDACYINKSMWNGSELTVHSKNGQHYTVIPPTSLASQITAVVTSEGKLSVSRTVYDYQLEKACNSVGEEFHGSHGFRHNFAQERMGEYTGQGISFNRALQMVSEDMSHHRPDITKIYLR